MQPWMNAAWNQLIGVSPITEDILLINEGATNLIIFVWIWIFFHLFVILERQ